MENSLQVQKTHTTDDIVRMGKVFFESKMFNDLTNMAQAIVKVQAGAELGIPPFQAISGVHIISGKAVIGAGLMASMVDRNPEYDFEVLQQTDDICEIKFYKNGKVRGISKFTKDDALRAGTKNMGKFPANMLYARAMSNGVKWYAPGVFAGPVYVPEEMQSEVTEETTYKEVEPVKTEFVKLAREKQVELIKNLLNSHHVPEDYRKNFLEKEAAGGDMIPEAEAQLMLIELQDMIAAGTTIEKTTPATPEHIQQIEQLLDDDVISPDEADKGRAKLAKGYTIAQANNVIKKLQEVIVERNTPVENEVR